MTKVISFFNHKGGVGKTTSVHNIGYELASKGKSVLLIDSDTQMNLTAAVYGLSTTVSYSEKEKVSEWKQYNQTYTALETVLRNIITKTDSPITVYEDNTIPTLHLLRGSISLNTLDFDLAGLIMSKNNLTKAYFATLGNRLAALYNKYDFVLIDQSPSASSIINAILSLTADYVIVPATPTFFSVQAVNNLRDIWDNWKNLLDDYSETYNTDGLVLNAKFLGLLIQSGKRFKKGNAKHTEEWKKAINSGIGDFVRYKYSNSVSESEFKAIFTDSTPYIIATYVNFTDKLRSIAEKKGLPLVALTQADLPKEVENGQYFRSWKSFKASNSYVCDSLMKL